MKVAMSMVTLGLLLVAAAPAAGFHETALTVLEVALPVASDGLVVAGRVVDEGDHVLNAAVPGRCGLQPAETPVHLGVGFNCGRVTGLWVLSQISERPKRYHLTMQVTAYANYWVERGTLRVGIDGSCPAADEGSWTLLDGAVPRWVEATCTQEVTVPPQSCVRVGGTMRATWVGDHAPTPSAFDMSDELCA